jgi:uncharacterized membrane protein YsdA (DUF1294 family)
VSLLNLLTQSNIERWEMVIGILGICAMGGDKLLAIIGWDRTSEKTLHTIALLGGFWGIIFGAFLFHHKTSKPEFWPPILFAAALWVGLFFAIVFGYVRLPVT